MSISAEHELTSMQFQDKNECDVPGESLVGVMREALRVAWTNHARVRWRTRKEVLEFRCAKEKNPSKKLKEECQYWRRIVKKHVARMKRHEDLHAPPKQHPDAQAMKDAAQHGWLDGHTHPFGWDEWGRYEDL
jgi:hypothetical protein